MSEGMLAFLVIGGIVGFFVLTQWVLPTVVTKGVNNTVLRGAKHEGEQLVSQRLRFTSRATVDQVRSAVLSTVKVAPHVPPVLADAHLIQATDTHIIYGYGNKLQPHSFRAVLQLADTKSGTEGSWEIVNWHLGDGIVVGQSVMKRLIADINTALQSVDPNASLR